MARPKPAITIHGLREIRRNLDDLDDALGDLKAIHEAAAKLVEDTADPLVPRRSGALAGTLRSSGTKTGARVKAGFKRVPYAGPIHFGWPARGIRPQPFLYDALDRRRSEVVDLYEDRVDKLIDKHHL